jgi:hypothetical protein
MGYESYLPTSIATYAVYTACSASPSMGYQPSILKSSPTALDILLLFSPAK